MSALAHEADLDVTQLVLDVVNQKIRGLDANVTQALTDGTLQRTITGASTLSLTVNDPKRTLLQSGIFSYAIQARLDRLFWRLAAVNKQGDQLILTFEDREVALLREHASPKKASRAKMTRAEFALSLVREVKPTIPFVCPELHVRQQVAPIANQQQARTDVSRSSNRQKGISASAKLTVKGKTATASQIRIGEQVLDVADSLNADAKAQVALVAACITESLIQNLSSGMGSSTGILQVLASTAQSMGINARDPSQCANAFLRRGFTGKGGAITLAKQNPSMSAGQIAQAVQGSGHPTAYDKWVAEAQTWVDAYAGGKSVSGVIETSTVVKQLPYQFTRGTPDGARENSWTALTRLASEVKWRCFMSAGSLYFISDDDLMAQKPRLILSESSPGIDAIDFDIDSGKLVQEVTISCRARRWVAAPGAVVELQDVGVANGRWLVSNIQRGLYDASAQITLTRPTQPLLEPAPQTSSSTISRSVGAGSQADRAYLAAQQITSKHYPYVWGGGHAHCGTPDRGTGRDPGIGYDCSGSVCAVLANAGMGFKLGSPAEVSGAIAASWGQPGPGQRITVWANSVHVWMTIDGKHFGTGDWGKGWGGPGFNPTMHPTAGFTPRHWPGT